MTELHAKLYSYLNKAVTAESTQGGLTPHRLFAKASGQQRHDPRAGPTVTPAAVARGSPRGRNPVSFREDRVGDAQEVRYSILVMLKVVSEIQRLIIFKLGQVQKKKKSCPGPGKQIITSECFKENLKNAQSRVSGISRCVLKNRLQQRRLAVASEHVVSTVRRRGLARCLSSFISNVCFLISSGVDACSSGDLALLALSPWMRKRDEELGFFR